MWGTPEKSSYEPQWGDNKLTRTDISALAREPAGLVNYRDDIVNKIVGDAKNAQQRYISPETIAWSDLEIYANDPKPLAEQLVKRGFLPQKFQKQVTKDDRTFNTFVDTIPEFCKAISSVPNPFERKIFILKLLLQAVLKRVELKWKPATLRAPPIAEHSRKNYDAHFIRLVHQYQTQLTQYSNNSPFSRDCIVGNQVWSDLHRRIFGKPTNIKEQQQKEQLKQKTAEKAIFTDRHIDGKEIVLTQEEQAIVKALEHTYPHIPKEHIMTTVCWAKAAGIPICRENMLAAFTLRGMESGHQIDVHKTREQLQAYIQKIEKVIDSITYILDDTGDKYFYAKLTELKEIARKNSSISQARLFERTNTIIKDITTPWALHDALYQSLVVNVATSNAVRAWYASKGIERYPGESNFDVLVRMLRAKPWSFWKYEISTDVLVSKIVSSDLTPWETEKKIIWNRWKSAYLNYDKMNLVNAMQWRASSITQIEMEKIYRQYFFKDEIMLYSDGTWIIKEENMRYFLADHNAWPFACRNSAIQDALNKKLNEHLIIDGDLTAYDLLWQPVYTNSYTVQALTKYVDRYYTWHGDTKNIVETFVQQSRSLALQANPLYKHIMQNSTQKFVIPEIRSESWWSVLSYAKRWERAYKIAYAWWRRRQTWPVSIT